MIMKMHVAFIVGSTPFEDLERCTFVDEDLMVTGAALQAAVTGTAGDGSGGD